MACLGLFLRRFQEPKGGCWREGSGLSDASTTTGRSLGSSAHDMLQTPSSWNLSLEEVARKEGQEPLRLVELCDGLLFAQPAADLGVDTGCAPDGADGGEKLVRAEAAEISALGIRILGPQMSPSTNISQDGVRGFEADHLVQIRSKTPAGREREHKLVLPRRPSARPDDLVVPCRSALVDTPKMVKLIGARLCRGRIARFVVLVEEDGEQGRGTSEAACAASLACEIEHRRGTPERVSLKEAVAAVREAQMRQDAAALEAHQRQLCSRLMCKDRQRMLGLL